MKRFAIITTFIALLLSGLAYAGEQSCTLSVDNMSCASCPYIIKQALTAVPGVVDVKVSFEDKKATVVYDDSKADIAALTAATTNAGFPSQLVE